MTQSGQHQLGTIEPYPMSKSDRTPEHDVSFIRVFVRSETFPRHFKPQNNPRSAWGVISQVLESTAPFISGHCGGRPDR